MLLLSSVSHGCHSTFLLCWRMVAFLEGVTIQSYNRVIGDFLRDVTKRLIDIWAHFLKCVCLWVWTLYGWVNGNMKKLCDIWEHSLLDNIAHSSHPQRGQVQNCSQKFHLYQSLRFYPMNAQSPTPSIISWKPGGADVCFPFHPKFSGQFVPVNSLLLEEASGTVNWYRYKV